MSSFKVVVVGSFVQDLTFTCDEFPHPGETIIGQSLTGPGGKGSNQAVAAARAGGRVTYIGAVGNDAFGHGARAFQTGEGIDCRMIEKPATPTGTAAILVNAHAQNEIVVALGANGVLTPADIDAQADAFRSAAVMVTQLEANLEATAHAMKTGRSKGAVVVLNPAPMRLDFDSALLLNVDILIPNETEFASLVNSLPQTRGTTGAPPFTEHDLGALSDENLHSLCRRFGVATLIVTLGVRGCFISSPSGHNLVPAMKGIRAIDTTGAGDAFVGAFATALAELGLGKLAEAARFANACAAISVTRPGTAPAMPKRHEIDALLREQSPA